MPRYPIKDGGAFDRSCLNLPLAGHKRTKGEGRGAQVAGSTPTRLALSQIDAMNYQAVTLFPSKVYPTAAVARRR
jgi:hypothetical protein